MNESDVDVKRNLDSAMMTSAFLLEEAVISNDDVSIADWKEIIISNYDVSIQQSARSARAGSPMMTSAAMSSQSAESYSATS
ncbi:putative protein phosphatase 2C 27 [Dorcoceras hygrometricum]|uniref:Uncharacterized protein n=1 Tax=Dorcoceras hygrometricum TaxID=472368 RepID=A0A2Z7C3I4_9LAMI|nr:putative protein phosphatase 2C 27 [Dorcoceras hygrometricum]